jgi:hypothetical protein
MYSDIHTGIGSAILTIAAIAITITRSIGKRRALRARRRI